VYLEAKWVSYKTGYPLLYKPFKYSNRLILSQHESRSILGKCQIGPILWRHDDPLTVYQKHGEHSNLLYTVKYFSDTSWGGEHAKRKGVFHIDWDDPVFKSMIQKMVFPTGKISYTIIPPKDRTSVALHFRTGGRFDLPDMHNREPHKAPSLDFYIKYLEYLYRYLGQNPLYVFVFSDSLEPEKVLKELRDHFRGFDIEFDMVEDKTYENRVIEDFFSLTLFDCSIHPMSNFSKVAGLISDYKIEIAPVSIEDGNKLKVILKEHTSKNKRPIYKKLESWKFK